MFGVILLILMILLACGISQAHQTRKVKQIEKAMENRKQERQKQIEEYIESKKYVKIK